MDTTNGSVGIVQTIRKSCEALFDKGQVAELRILDIAGSKGFTYNAGGWFNDWELLANAAEKYEKRNPSGIYVTINQLDPACIARTSNRITERIKQTTSDRDILKRFWLPIDIDPQRPAGVSSSDTELQNAAKFSDIIADYLENELGFPQGIKAHSGNGIHLLYKIDLKNDDDSKQLVKDVLNALADKFNNAQIHIDTTLFNAARILKLWGTVARKGYHDDKRPHRRSKLWTEIPFGEIKKVSKAKLNKIAKEWRSKNEPKGKNTKKKKKTSKNQDKGRVSAASIFDLEKWIEENCIEVKKVDVFDGTGKRFFLESCLFDSSHRGTSAVLGRAPNGSIFYKCQHESCANKTWADVRALFPNTAISTDEQEENTPWDFANQFIDDMFLDSALDEITLRRHREQYYIYSQRRNIYEAVTLDHMKVMLTRWLGENGYKNTVRNVNDILNSLSSIVTVSEMAELPFRAKIDTESRAGTSHIERSQWVTLRNGILDIEKVLNGQPVEDSLMNHTTEWFSISSLTFPFPVSEKEEQCDTWLAFLDEIFQEDSERIMVLQEMFGYCFFRDTKLEKFFILHGQGTNGKSTVLNVLTMLLGEINVSSLSLDQLADPRLRFELYQKSANICTDLPEMDKVEEGIIKRITSGEPVIADRKYKDAIKFTPTTKIVFSTNALPRFTDTSLGIWRRMVLIPFDYVVPPSKIRTNLIEEFKSELPGIFVWALRGASRLRHKGNFAKSQVCESANRGYKMDCFPIYTFIDECTNPEGSVGAKDLWQTYRNWCREFGLTKVKPLHSFIKDVVAFQPDITYPRVKNGMVAEIMLGGIELKDTPFQERKNGDVDTQQWAM